MRNFFLSIFALMLFSSAVSAQRTCAAEDVLAQQLLENPAMVQEMENIRRHTEQFIQQGGASDRAVVTIPVVVHVVYYNATQNISDAQIATQIQVLNDDFRRLNSDASNTPAVWQGIAADCEVQFCMAQQDPNGNATNGIVRKSTTVNGFSTNNNVKFNSTGGSDIWDRNKYLNIWVCNLSGGLLGYAQFPGGGATTDGVVCDYAYFGTIGTATFPFNLGRTATHEVGHWLNCYHIWGDDGTSCTGTDQAADTPNQADENYACPTFPTISCSNGPNGDMFMNYMDYTDDACMNLFTNGQKARMQALFASGGFRQSLTTSNGCDAPGGGGSCGTPAGLNATNITQTTVTLNWGAVSGATSYNLQLKVSTSGTWQTFTGLTGTSQGFTGLTAGTTYDYQVQAVCGGTTGSYSSAASFTTLSGSCSDAYEANNTRSTAKVIPVNTTFTAQIATTTDKDWYRFSNTTATKNIKIDLTTLPFDYDLKLYRSSTNLATSQNSGTADEQIIYNTTTVSTSYYAYVYGYNGAYSSTSCYTLRVSLSTANWRTDGSTDGITEEIEIPVIFEDAGFGMFPNPAANQLTVEVPMEADGDVAVSIFDPAGKVALQQHSTMGKGNNQMTFDLNKLPNGVYFVQVRNGEIAKTRKLVIQK
jgi:Pregnancy-associated plasma protein-A/Secretion system C-terminal sorting domain/Fibronectin type III domain